MNLKDLISAATSHGATVEDDSAGEWKTYQVVAPEGKWWNESTGPHLRVEWHTHGAWKNFRDQAISDAIERMTYGFMDAEDE